MRKTQNFLYYWVPPLTWMGLIFYMSSQKSIAITTNVVTDFVTFKTLHMIEYAFLFFLFYRAFQSIKSKANKISGLFSFPIVILYSLTDELHQLFIPSRQGRIRDVLFDIFGMLVMYVIIKKIRIIQKLL
jgi:VanZ family protein